MKIKTTVTEIDCTAEELRQSNSLRLLKSVNVLAESTDMQTSLSIGMNPREINNAIPTDDF